MAAVSILCMAANLAAELKLFRNRLRLTQEELAARLGVGRPRYARWERDRTIPNQYLEMLKEMGFAPGSPIHSDTGAPMRVRATRGQLRLLIQILADAGIDNGIRRNAEQELMTALGIDQVPDEEFSGSSKK